MAREGVSQLKFLTRLTPSPKKAKKKTTFQNYELEDIRQKCCLKIYKCKCVTELIYFPKFLSAVAAVLQALLLHFLYDEIPACAFVLETGFQFAWLS